MNEAEWFGYEDDISVSDYIVPLVGDEQLASRKTDSRAESEEDSTQSAQVHEIEIETKFVEVSTGTFNELGFKWDMDGKKEEAAVVVSGVAVDPLSSDVDGDGLSARQVERLKSNVTPEPVKPASSKPVSAPEPARPAKPVVPAQFNPYVLARENAFSTFSIDVDTASYGLARTQLQNRQLPVPESVRTEEFINSFDYDYRPPAGAQTFAIHKEMAPSPFRLGLDALKIGIKGRRIGRDDHRGAMLTLVIDTSGSMDTPERLGLIKQSLAMLLNQLSPSDEVAIVQFGGQARLVLDHTPVSRKGELLAAIQSLQAGGPTQFDQGLALGYRVATDGFRAGDSNRILILSDGVANVGELTPEAILKQVAENRKKGIYLSVLGFGAGAYDDDLLEQLADRGDGMYAYIDTEDEARLLLVDRLASTLHVIASDVKIQVEFNPARVARYRQLGYENRQLTKQQFRDDTVDAGEVGSGQSVTALYDVELIADGPADEPIATVYVRYRRADNGLVEEISSRVTDAVRAATFSAADARFKLAVCTAEFAEHLRRSPYADGTELRDVLEQLKPVVQALDLDKQVQELYELMAVTDRMER
jgi:Ca-activated chloride channel family protein